MASWREQVAPDWAKALEPVEPTLARLGTFLRDELVAGHEYLPASGAILRAFETPLSDVLLYLSLLTPPVGRQRVSPATAPVGHWSSENPRTHEVRSHFSF